MWLLVVLLVLLMLAIQPEIPSPRTLYYFWKLPGPRGFPIVGNLFTLSFVPRQELFNCATSYFQSFPRVFASYMFGHCLCFLEDADDIKMMLKNTKNFDHGIQAMSFKDTLGTGILTYTGEDRPARKKLLTPIYQADLLDQVIESTTSATSRMVQDLKSVTGNVDVGEFPEKYLVHAILESAGIRCEEKVATTLTEVNKKLGVLSIKRIVHSWQMSKVLLMTLGFPDWLKMKKLIKLEDSAMGQAVTEAKTELNGGKYIKNKFIHNLLGRSKEQPGMMNFNHIVDETKVYIGAASDTSSSAICSTLYSLGLYPHHQDVIYDEITEEFPEGEKMSLKKLNNLKYLTAFIKEVLRLYPPISYIPRLLAEDLVLGDGKMIPKGVTVAIFPFLLHRNEKYFPRAEEFEPDRFLLDEVDPNTYIPFGAGTKSCLGNKIAVLILKVFVISILRQFKIEAVTKKEDIKYVPELVLRPDRKIECKFIVRNK